MFNLDTNIKNQKVEIKIQGQLKNNTKSILNQFEIVSSQDFSILKGTIENQDSLYKVLTEIKLLNLTLISVNQL